MDELSDLTNTLTQINDVCDKIIRKAVPIMKKIITNKDKLIEEIKESNKDMEDKDIRLKLQQTGLSLVKDAKNVKKEMNKLIHAIVTNWNIEDVDIPFFHDVWYGDTYDCEKLDALKALLTDLNEQLSHCTLEHIVEISKN